MTTLRGKKAMVLGGSRGIGAAIVRKLAAEGADVVFTYAAAKAAADAVAGETGARAELVDSADRSALIKAVSAQGPLDILVVNAGIGLGGDPLSIDPDAIDRMIDINVRAPYHASVEAAKKMAQGGRILVIGSVNGDRAAFPGASAYSLTKSAVQGMVRGLARDLGDREIAVNAVQPGPVATDNNPVDGPMAPIMHSFMAIKRHIRPEEVADYVAFLAGPSGAMITGSMQTIDGGFGA